MTTTIGTKKKPPTSIADYESFLKGLVLRRISLEQCSSELDRPTLQKLLKAKAPVSRQLNSAYSLAKFGDNFFDCEGHFRVQVGGDRKSKSMLKAGPASKKPALTVECLFTAHFHFHEQTQKEFVEQFVQTELRLIMMPFARQFVADTTAKMSIPPLFLPLAP